MIHGIGVDLCEISRVRDLIDRRGESFVKRILAPSEYEEFSILNGALKAAFCAKRFAAKEAFSKAFGTGIGRGFGFRNIWVAHSSIGTPELRWTIENQILCILTNANVCLSISDEKAIAIAFCTIEFD